MTSPFKMIDHVQLAMPAGREEEARAFYARILGMRELKKPAEKAARGGVWFASVGVQIHLGVDPDFTPAKKAHPGLLCTNYAALISKLQKSGIDVLEEPAPDGSQHAYVHDPFGNRIELIG